MTAAEATSEPGMPRPFEVVCAYDPDSPEWQQSHTEGLGSSDAAAAIGLSPYCSPYVLYLEKADEFDRFREDDDMERMYWGRKLEPAVADRFFELHPEYRETTSEPPTTVRSTLYPWMTASTDREITDRETGEPGILEIKTTGAFLAADWSGGVPDDVTIQVLHQLVVTGYQRAWVAVLIGGNRYQDFFISSSEHQATISMLIDKERAFWQRVTDRNPPPIDGSDSTQDAVRFRAGESEPGYEIDLPDEALALRRLRDANRDQADSYQLAATQAENQLIEMLGTAEAGRVDGLRVVTFKSQTSRRLDTTAIREAHPEIASEFTNESTSRVLRFPKLPEEA